jgi:hypothetical protein
MSLRVIWQYMDRSVTQNILYGPMKYIILVYTQYDIILVYTQYDIILVYTQYDIILVYTQKAIMGFIDE